MSEHVLRCCESVLDKGISNLCLNTQTWAFRIQSMKFCTATKKAVQKYKYFSRARTQTIDYIRRHKATTN